LSHAPKPELDFTKSRPLTLSAKHSAIVTTNSPVAMVVATPQDHRARNVGIVRKEAKAATNCPDSFRWTSATPTVMKTIAMAKLCPHRGSLSNSGRAKTNQNTSHETPSTRRPELPVAPNLILNGQTKFLL